MIAIECLGFQIRISYSLDTWAGLMQLQLAAKYANLLVDDLRPHLAKWTFIKALQRRERLRK